MGHFECLLFSTVVSDCQLMVRPAFYLSRTTSYQLIDPGGMEGLLGLGENPTNSLNRESRDS